MSEWKWRLLIDVNNCQVTTGSPHAADIRAVLCAWQSPGHQVLQGWEQMKALYRVSRECSSCTTGPLHRAGQSPAPPLLKLLLVFHFLCENNLTSHAAQSSASLRTLAGFCPPRRCSWRLFADFECGFGPCQYAGPYLVHI